MSDTHTDEELQALKSWWQDNGKSLMIAVVASLAIVGGWKGWQHHQTTTAESASILYQGVVDSVTKLSASNTDSNTADESTAYHLGGQLKDEFSDSAYAKLAALLLARVAVEAQDYDRALTELDWVLAHEPNESQKSLALVRKARLLAAKEQFDKALPVLDGVKDPAFKSQSEEAKGDIYIQRGEADKARSAYQAAIDAATDQTLLPRLQMKLDNLAL